MHDRPICVLICALRKRGNFQILRSLPIVHETLTIAFNNLMSSCTTSVWIFCSQFAYVRDNSRCCNVHRLDIMLRLSHTVKVFSVVKLSNILLHSFIEFRETHGELKVTNHVSELRERRWKYRDKIQTPHRQAQPGFETFLGVVIMTQPCDWINSVKFMKQQKRL